MSVIFWKISGIINLLGGIAIWAIRWPNWQLQVPADPLFMAVAPIGIINLALAVRRSRFWFVWLPLNSICGLISGLFAALNFESFSAGVVTALLSTLPAVLAFFSLSLKIK